MQKSGIYLGFGGDFMIAAFIVAIGYIGSLKIKAGVNQTSVSRGVGVASK